MRFLPKNSCIMFTFVKHDSVEKLLYRHVLVFDSTDRFFSFFGVRKQ